MSARKAFTTGAATTLGVLVALTVGAAVLGRLLGPTVPR